MILETTFLVDLIRGNAAAAQKVAAMEKRGELLLISAVSVFEIYQGMRRDSEKAKQKVEALFESVPILPLDFPAAKDAGKIMEKLLEEGNPVEATDCMIAGTAKQLNQAIITRDAKHFKRIPGLKIEGY